MAQKKQRAATGPGATPAVPDKVYIICSGGRWTVDPMHKRASGGQQVTWHAMGTGAKLLFQDPGVFGTDVLPVPNGKDASGTVSQGLRPGFYPYAVYCARDNCLATGSEAGMIIEP